ncbi:hypothetical protein BCR42DRAFT_423282 [Absidia repens]|uniref:Uncharacterized protein n=1 Tax=Absidia repens TaxID=90262 RepID=A0A1X2I5P4_9FUNG|nr:hypothetical protein BCR42DRAFT_423282 [Absidia repens]
MSLLRIFKSKGNVFIVVFICSVIFFLSALLPSTSSQFKETTQQQGHQSSTPSRNKYSRIKDDKKQQLLYSALGHIRIGYVANRTPDVDTPPLLVMYSCKSPQMPCGSWGKRLLDMTHAYYFSMLVDGTAFTADMSDPVGLASYFKPHPGFMALQPSQAYHYIQQMDDNERQNKVRNLTMQTMTLDPNINYADHFKQGQTPVRMLQTTQWPEDSITNTFQISTPMKHLRDKYRLNELPETSEWFWLVYRLLFNPSDWLASQLEPHRMLMGGSVTWGESLSLMDPRNQVDATVSSSWFRIGLRLDHPYQSETSAAAAVDCWLKYIDQLCVASKKKQCHLFVSSAIGAAPLEKIKRYNKWSLSSASSTAVVVHTVDDKYAFATMGQDVVDVDQKKKKALFESDEQHATSLFARQVMDWMILSRMDYLLGSRDDDFIRTAAWAAQVQTDLLMDDTSCQIKPMMDW